MSQIILYTTHCPQCNALKQMLESAKLVYQICDDQETMINLGFLSAPMLQVDDNIMNFKEAINWINGVNK